MIGLISKWVIINNNARVCKLPADCSHNCQRQQRIRAWPSTHTVTVHGRGDNIPIKQIHGISRGKDRNRGAAAKPCDAVPSPPLSVAFTSSTLDYCTKHIPVPPLATARRFFFFLLLLRIKVAILLHCLWKLLVFSYFWRRFFVFVRVLLSWILMRELVDYILMKRGAECSLETRWKCSACGHLHQLALFSSSSFFFIIFIRGYAQRGPWVWLPTVTPVCPRPPARQVRLPCKVKRRDARVKATVWPHVGDPLTRSPASVGWLSR